MRIKLILREINGNGHTIQKKNIEDILKKYENGFKIITKEKEIEVLSKNLSNIYLTYLEYLKRDFSKIVDVEDPQTFLIKIER